MGHHVHNNEELNEYIINLVNESREKKRVIKILNQTKSRAKEYVAEIERLHRVNAELEGGRVELEKACRKIASQQDQIDKLKAMLAAANSDTQAPNAPDQVQEQVPSSQIATYVGPESSSPEAHLSVKQEIKEEDNYEDNYQDEPPPPSWEYQDSPQLDIPELGPVAHQTPTTAKRLHDEIDGDLLVSRKKTSFKPIVDDDSPVLSASKISSEKPIATYFKPKLHEIKNDNKFVKALMKQKLEPNDFKINKEMNDGISYAYQETTRGKKRRELPGRPCKECARWYLETADIGPNVQSCKHGSRSKTAFDNARRVSRHRDKHDAPDDDHLFERTDIPESTQSQEHQREQFRARKERDVQVRLHSALEGGVYMFRDEKLQKRVDKVDLDELDGDALEKIYGPLLVTLS